MRLAVANEAHRGRISLASPRAVVVTAQLQRCICSGAVRGEAMSHPSPTTYPFNTRKKRSVRLRIEAATMRAGIIVLAQLVLCGSARAATEYAVDGLTVGTQVDSGSARYREYKC